ncbi:MbtH family protein [Nitrosomonas communis]|nr:MbtH family NRPS accessory protein [Nitrosomonas communis]
MNKLENEHFNDDLYEVVVNHEQQYSIWPNDREIPLGWHKVGQSGGKQKCLEYIASVWEDMRPLSLRRKMEKESLS